MTARIYRPTRNTMQSGKGKTSRWVLEFEPSEPREIEPLMGYTATRDTRTQVRLTFESRDAAEAYAQRNGIAYQIQPAHEATVKRAAYTDNFRFDRKTPWTH